MSEWTDKAAGVSRKALYVRRQGYLLAEKIHGGGYGVIEEEALRDHDALGAIAHQTEAGLLPVHQVTHSLHKSKRSDMVQSSIDGS